MTYYETRQNFKQLSYIIYLDPMHGCEVIKCMKLGEVFCKSVISRKLDKFTDPEKNINGLKLDLARVAHIGPSPVGEEAGTEVGLGLRLSEAHQGEGAAWTSSSSRARTSRGPWRRRGNGLATAGSG